MDTQNKLLQNLVSEHQSVQASKLVASAVASVDVAVVSEVASEEETVVDLVIEAASAGEEVSATKAVVDSEAVEASQMARHRRTLQVDLAAQGVVVDSVVGTELDLQMVLGHLTTAIVAAMGTVLEVIETTAVVPVELRGLTAAEIHVA